MKIAFVYDRVNKFGGAERVLLALHEIWPDAPLYTAIYNKKSGSWANKFKVIPSFLKDLPLSSTNHEIFPLTTPYAFESFDFRKFDVVLTITSSDAKGIITNPNTLHICYLLTPTRYLWNGYFDHLANPGFGKINPFVKTIMKIFTPVLRKWDFIASYRPDVYISISNTVAKRIKCYYKRSATLIYPPVETEKFVTPQKCNIGEFFLVVSRLVSYKKIDYVISTFKELGWNLKIIGSGIDKKRLKKISSKNIEFIDGSLTDEKLCWYYQNCRGLIFSGEEDFGISAVEAQACGKPVIALNKGGITEIIIPGVTGEIYNTADEDSLIHALNRFINKNYKMDDCRKNATRFSKQKFHKNIKIAIENYWKIWKTNKLN
ncbi:glycosyltransferase [Candidatus Gottesmanbacteria bacterium]|nr:glycosyltransferase [Candidatus Gottesmanbacteria bacterium]